MKNRVRTRIIRIAVLIGLILSIGTAGFRIIERYPLFDAFYMTLTTITTVGYQEIHPLSRAGRVFNSFLIFFGVSAMLVALGTMTQTIIELELQERFGKRRKKRMIDQLRNHFIVCGFGRVGRNAALELKRAKKTFLVVDRSEERVDRAMRAGMLAVVADATRDDSLREAGVLSARGLIAALPSDAENLFIILSAKTLNPNLTVVTRASEEEAGEKLRRAGADTVFAPYTMAGHRLAHALVRPHVVEFFDFATSAVGPRIMTEQVWVAPGSIAAGKPLSAIITAGESDLIILAIRKANGEMVFNPSPATQISGGDYFIVLGRQPQLEKLEKLLTGD